MIDNMNTRELRAIRSSAHQFLLTRDRSCTTQEIARHLFGAKCHEEPVSHLVVRNILGEDRRVCVGHDGRWFALDAGFLARSFDATRFAALDLETTGSLIGVDRIIEVGLAVYENGRIVETFESLVHCTRHLNGRIRKLTGIHPQDLVDAPTFESLAPKIVDILGTTHVFVGHDVRFDQNFLRWELQRHGYELPELVGLCTLRLSQLLWPDLDGWRLQDLAANFDVAHDRPHRAGEDALATAGVLACALDDATDLGAGIIADLFRRPATMTTKDKGDSELAARAG